MKIIDKFLKKLNASRNTFATYILTMISIYIVVDRVVEMLFMIFTESNAIFYICYNTLCCCNFNVHTVVK